MIYIICALKCEAQAFVDKYKLDKSKKNETVTIVVSGVGKQNMQDVASRVVSEMQNDDTILNVGICAGDESFKIGELVDASKHKLTCLDNEISQRGIYTLVDMESDGFLQATKGIKNSYIFKIVSDHFEPQNITKEFAKSLVFNAIDDINRLLKQKAKK
ncbi:hypothetical protein M947_08440 [Sulfurimonas hongkongensis]|uniref:Nucleoside phosphorylase domain-containing protein n=1 Tax=Sulfurimonas hongkongensis TaxID=1172190 RepID=T0L098_9BACT|nr:hypothetical protein [Sulfurimonas hongkongensis]EQB39173.1 hypothetical protein M947_08440 [Sulfurimonas hongkongensis]